jgi:hypothetical protein
MRTIPWCSQPGEEYNHLGVASGNKKQSHRCKGDDLPTTEIKIMEQDSEQGEPRHDAPEVTAGQTGNGDNAVWVPYAPSLEAGISAEWDHKNARRIELAKKKARQPLTAEEEAEFQALQKGFFAYLETRFPRQLITRP